MNNFQLTTHNLQQLLVVRDYVFDKLKKIFSKTRSGSQNEINIGQNIDATSLFQDRLLLIEAARSNDVSAIEALLLKGVDINTKDMDDNTALILAARHGQRACIQKNIFNLDFLDGCVKFWKSINI